MSHAFLVFLASVAAVLGALAVVGVRDCALLCRGRVWAPAGTRSRWRNVTAVLALAAALVWRYRDSAWPSACALGVSRSC